MENSNSVQGSFYNSSTATASTETPAHPHPASGFARGKPTASSRSRSTTISSERGNSPAGPRFQCTKCPKNFSRIENLTRHQANHDEVGKFVCPVCRKRFTRSDLLNRHKRIHPKDASSSDPSNSHVISNPSSSTTSAHNRSERTAPGARATTSSSHGAPAPDTRSGILASQPPPSTMKSFNPTPNPVLLQHFMSHSHLTGIPAQSTQTQGLTNLVEAALAPSNLAQPTSLTSNLVEDGLFTGLGIGNSAGYMGSYDADISWALDSYSGENTSTYSSDYDMTNTFDPSAAGFRDLQYPSARQTPPPPQDPIDVADNEDDDTNDWPDKVANPSDLSRRAPRIVPLQFVPFSWQPLLNEARSFGASPNGTFALPNISSRLRQSLINILNEARYEFTMPEISSSMFPPSEALDFFLQLFLRHIHPRFTILHLPTFDIFNCPPLLLVSMMLLGSSHSTTDRGRFSRIFHGPLRIACSRLHEVDPNYLRSLDNILTYFFLCLAGTWSGSKESYEFSEGARGILVTACRRKRLLDCRPTPIDATRYQDAGFKLDEAKWAAWIEVEKGKRLGLSVYMFDCQYPALFNNQHFVSKAETTNLTFPCDDELWSAPSAQLWEALLGPTGLPQPEYWLRALNGILLHRYMKPTPPIVPAGQFGQTLLLYAIHTHIFDWRQATCMLSPTGLMDVTAKWDMGNPLRERRIWLFDALDSWAECYQNENTSTATCLLHRLGYIALDLNLSDMHLVAGRSNNRDDGNFAEHNLKRWANSSTAPSTMSHIFSMLEICHNQIENGGASRASYEIAVCLFTGGIVCWAFARLKGGLGPDLEKERCIRAVVEASAALKTMGCWRMGSMFGRILSRFEVGNGH